MAWTLCTSGAAIAKAGANANSTIVASGATLELWSDQAEGSVNAETRYDWVSNWSDVGANYQGALEDATSSKIALNIINYDMSGYTSRTEAQTMLDVNNDMYRKNISYLKDKQNQEKMV